MTATVLKESTTLLNSTLPFITEFLTSQTWGEDIRPKESLTIILGDLLLYFIRI
jgi:hypothetical protein